MLIFYMTKYQIYSIQTKIRVDSVFETGCDDIIICSSGFLQRV